MSDVVLVHWISQCRARWLTTIVFGIATGFMRPDVAGAETTPAPKVEPPARSFVVFAGLDIFVDDHGTRQPVVGGSDQEVVVWDERRNATVTLRAVALSAAVEPRLTGTSVSIEHLKEFSVYSPANDPKAAAHAQQVFMHNLEGARAEESEMGARAAQAVADSYGSIAPSVSPDSPGAASYQAQMNAAIDQAASATGEMASTYANPVYRDSRVGSPAGNDNFDGYAVAFEVSAPQRVDNVYGVLRLRYRESSQPGALVGNAMKMFRVRQLDAKPRKVVVRQYGLPPGYVVDSFQIHLYANGQELAANTSPNRVEVTEAEAHQFLILRHVQLHPGATLPAQVARELQRERPAVVAGRGLEEMLVNLDVTADGTVASVRSDGAITAPLTDVMLAELRKVRFLPALVNGRPVASPGTFAVRELFR